MISVVISAIYTCIYPVCIFVAYMSSFLLTEILESSYSKAVKQVSIQVIVSLTTLRIAIGSTMLQRSVQWVSISLHLM